MDYTIYYIAIPVIIVVAVIGWIMYERSKKTTDRQTGGDTVIPLLEPGWQFFPSLTNGNPPGTIFRITPEKQRYMVSDVKNAPLHNSKQTEGKKTRKIETGTSMLVKILGINFEGNVGGDHREDIVFEMSNSEKEATADKEIDDLVKKEMIGVTVRQKNRYFVIRETIATEQIDFEIKRDLVERLGGEASVKDKIEAKATVFSKKDAATFELKRTFDEPMRVMFSAEEIFVKESGVTFRGPGGLPSGKEITRSPVIERLEFMDAD